eukprot:TRINITY_DN1733_c0_g1_i1.p1 TRINITY_DN1733_c0_g1~~TRINITY_DN1733_c0_g1_i1.p1  ORF type:complete len:525 (-),score=112.63 TRINITY_DN1733_c0_g1_i1:318-1799(-)
MSFFSFWSTTPAQVEEPQPEQEKKVEDTVEPTPDTVVPVSNFKWFSYPDAPKEIQGPAEAPSENHPPAVQEASFFSKLFSVSTYTGGSSGKEEGNPYGVAEHQRQGLWSLLSESLGMDVTNITMPVWLFEPTTFLSRMAEVNEFSDLLIKGSNCPNSLDRILYVAIFAGTAFCHTERYGKPFNSVLGETFEFTLKNGTRGILEQVSHHPPVGAMHVEHKQFKIWQDSSPKTKLLGNSIDLFTNARTHISFPNTDDHFYYTTPKTRAHNIIIGRTWVDHYGDLTLTNIKTGESCVLNFIKCGWLGKGRYEIEGVVYDAEGNTKISIWGKWNEALYAKWLFDGGDKPKDKEVCLWKKPSNYSSGKWKISNFGQKLVALDSDLEKVLPSTDSRLRPDRRELEADRQDKASKYKSLIEERQRADRRQREQSGVEWVPRNFQKTEDHEGNSMWTYFGKYWEEREQRAKQISEGQELKHSLGDEDLACDFRSPRLLESI